MKKNFYLTMCCLGILLLSLPAIGQVAAMSQDYDMPATPNGYQWVEVTEYFKNPQTKLERVRLYLADVGDKVEIYYTNCLMGTEVKVSTVSKSDKREFNYLLAIESNKSYAGDDKREVKFFCNKGKVYVLLKT